METIVTMVIPKVVQNFIDVVFPNHDFQAYRWEIGLLVALVVFMIVGMAVQNRYHRIFAETAVRNLQTTLFRHLRKLGLSYYETHQTGDTFALMNTDVDAVKRIYYQYLPFTIWMVMWVLIAGGVLFTIHWKLTLAILACFLVYYTVGPYLEKKAHQASKRTYEQEWPAMQRKMHDTITSMVELRAYAREKWEGRRFQDDYEKFSHGLLITIVLAYMRGGMRRLSSYVGAFVLLLYGSVLIAENSLSIGGFVAFNLYYYGLITTLTHLITNITEQRLLMVQVGRLRNFLEEVPVVAETEDPVRVPEVHGEIELEKVSFGYPGRPPVIQDLSLHIAGGEQVAIVGFSGCGKSTLLKLIGRFYDVQHGEICLDSVPLKKMEMNQLRDSLGLVFQDAFLFGASIRENILFGNPDASEEELIQASTFACAHEFILELPEGYDTQVGERGYKLSGGQKQRIAIARMFLKNPKVLLLDEATSALDNRSEQVVQQSLEQLSRSRTTITVAHRLSTVRHCDRIVVMDQGRIVEMGAFDELVLMRGHFYRLLEGGNFKPDHEVDLNLSTS